MTSPGKTGTGAKEAASLALVSFLALFLELALIRWVPGCLKVIGYYTNLVLISSFLGLGLGCAAEPDDSSAQSLTRSLSFRLFISLSLYSLIHYVGLFPLPSFWGERVWLNVSGLFPSMIVPEIVFVLNVWTFIPLGRRLGSALSRFRPLPGYSINLGGSIAGVLAITAMSVMGASPLLWFGAAGAVYLFWMLLEGLDKRRVLIYSLLWAAAVIATVFPTRGAIWSPYYKISLATGEKFLEKLKFDPEWSKSLGFLYLSVNDDYFQFAVNLDPRVVSDSSRDLKFGGDLIGGIADYVNFPYQMHPPGRTLILGAGLGNDVAAAVRAGNDPIDAVEIDPAIAGLGRERHPERPYSSPRVALHVTDARRFLKRAEGPYDSIVYAFLDSHTLLSAHSSIRLDTFVYTRESFEEAARLLSPDGVMVVMFASSRDFVGRRLFYLVHSIFPDSTRAWMWDGGQFGHDFDVIAAGPGLKKYTFQPKPRFKEVTQDYLAHPPEDLPSDNWPFLYLEKRTISPGYAITLAAILVISYLFTRRTIPRFSRINPHFCLLGAGFLLLETKSITEISLLFGSTWMVNAGVISAFLIMAMLANLLVAKVSIKNPTWAYVALGAALFIAFIVPVHKLLLGNPVAAAALGSALVALPVAFSGIVFSSSIKDGPDVALALGSNILGAVVGGLLEYSSLVAGFKAMYVLAAALYLGAYLFRKK